MDDRFWVPGGAPRVVPLLAGTQGFPFWRIRFGPLFSHSRYLHDEYLAVDKPISVMPTTRTTFHVRGVRGPTPRNEPRGQRTSPWSEKGPAPASARPDPASVALKEC